MHVHVIPILACLAFALPVEAQGEDPPPPAEEAPSGEEAPAAEDAPSGEEAPTAEDAPAAQEAPPAEAPDELLAVLPPVIASYPPPVFPQSALDASVEGTAVVRLNVSAEGAVTDVFLVRDPGEGLGSAAVEAIAMALFEPATSGGQPVPYEGLYFRVPVLHPDIKPPPMPEGEMAAELTQLPRLVFSVDAVYPEAHKEAGEQAVVQLEIHIDPYGEVTRVRVTRSGGPEFDRAALEAVWQFRFEPGYAGPIPVPVAITYDYVFAIEQKVVETVAETGYEDVDPEGPENYGGFVRERGTRNPMPNIEVYIEEFEISASTDAKGKFGFNGLPVGTWHVLILAPGFEAFSTEEDITQGERTDVVYFVRPSPVGANRTVVRVKKERKEVSQTTLTIEEIQQVAGTFGDPVKVVQNLPGVARSPFDFGLLIVRGSGPEDTGEYVDGIRVPLLYHFGGFRSVISPIMIDSIDFFPGGYGVRWGRTMGGVMNIATRKQWPDQIHGLARVDLIDSEAALIGPIKKDGKKIGGFGAAGRRSYIDLVLPVMVPPTVDLSRTVLPQWWDVQAKLALQPSPNVDFWAFVYASDDQTSQVTEEGEGSGQSDESGLAGFRTSFFRATAGGVLRPHANLNFDWSFGYSYDAIKLALGSAFGAASASNFMNGRGEFSWEPDSHVRAHLGFDYAGGQDKFEIYTTRVGQMLGDNPTAERESLFILGDITGHAPAAYLEGEIMPLGDDRLKLIPGIRFDYYNIIDGAEFSSADPRFAARGQITKTTSLKGSIGLFHQNPQPWEMFEGIGNTKLDPEESPQVVFGIEQQFTPFLSLDAQFFYKWMDNLVVMTFADVSSASDVWMNGGKGRVIGGEFFLRWRPHRNFFGWISYTISNSTRQDQPDEDWYTYEFDQPHILDIVGTYEFPYNIHVGLRFRLVSGNPTTPVMGAMMDVDGPGYSGLYGDYGSLRMPAFHQLDVRFDKEFIFRKWRLMAYLEIMNVYNRQNPEMELYNFDYTEKDYFNGLPFIPNLGLRAEF